MAQRVAYRERPVVSHGLQRTHVGSPRPSAYAGARQSVRRVATGTGRRPANIKGGSATTRTNPASTGPNAPEVGRRDRKEREIGSAARGGGRGGISAFHPGRSPGA